MKFLVSGSSGFVGSALMKAIANRGHIGLRLVRSSRVRDEFSIPWEPSVARIETARLQDLDAVIHLAGAGISDQRWTDDRKDAILESRTVPTRTLAGAVARLPNPPKVYISASAIGFYGNRGDEVLTEESTHGNGFLADVVRQWEASSDIVVKSGIRVVKARFGIILGPGGGMLAKVVPIFRYGFGGKLGSGRQWMSWIALQDVIGALFHAVETETLSGPVNFVSPNPVTNAEFTDVLSEVVDRRAYYTVPAFVLKLIYGQMAEETILSSQRVKPVKLPESGYKYRIPDLREALRASVKD
jgi:uncharacterized protein (TIGR01777 family)